MTVARSHLDAYVPDIACTWDEEVPEKLWRTIDGTLLFVDIAGFTSLSEKLAAGGRIGAEELTTVLNRVFGRMLDIASVRGGSLLKFGGDALLLLFRTDDHAMQACVAALEMRTALREASEEPTSVGRIQLRMSSGIHSGPVDLFLVGDTHRELIVAGPTTSITTEMEGIASGGEVVVSAETKGQLPASFFGAKTGEPWLVRKRKVDHPHPAPVSTSRRTGDDLLPFVPSALRDRFNAGIKESEHRVATVGFLGFSGVDDLVVTGGLAHTAQVVDRFVKAVQVAADDEGITFLASDVAADGGKIILTAGVPTRQSDDEGSVLRAFRRILNTGTPLTLRAGVHSGHVFAGEIGSESRTTFTIIGDTVNLSARMMTAAPTGALYVSPSVLDRAATLFRTEQVEAFAVKGKAHKVPAYAVFEETGIRPLTTSHVLPFGGRDAELELLVGIVETCAHEGSGGMMTISGDTGTGKSRLIAEVLRRCPGMGVLTVQAEPNGTDNPYWAFRDPLRAMLGITRSSQSEMRSRLEEILGARDPELLPVLPLLGDVLQIEVSDNELTGAIDAQFRPDRTADAVVALLESEAEEQLAVIAEDGHWMDAASIGLLRRIGDAATSRPWTVIFTARLDEKGFEPLGEEIRLTPLSGDAVRDIAVEATAAAPLRPHELDRVVERVDGNPLFLSEIIRMIRETGTADSLPESLEDVVSTEIDTLLPLPRQVLRYASVLGRSFRRAVLNALLGPEGFEMDDATTTDLARFLDSDGTERLRFRHAMVHDIAYEGLSYRRRRELHQRAGEIIEDFAGGDPEAVAAFLAFHYSESGVHDKAWRFARMAAEKARGTYATTEAVTHYRHALDAARHLDVKVSEVRDVWTQMGEMQDLSGQYEAARESFRHAVRVDSSDALEVAGLQLRQAESWFGSGNLTQAKRQLTLGHGRIGRSRGHEADGFRARLTAYQSSVGAASGDPIAAREFATAAIDLARSSGQGEALARAYGVLDWANFAMGIDESRRGGEAIRIYERLGLHERSVGIMNNMGAYAYLEGLWDQAIDWYEKAVQTAEQSGNVIEAARTKANIAELRVGQRRFQEAALLAEEAERVFTASNADQTLWLAQLQVARAEAGLGAYDTAVESLNDLYEGKLESGTVYEVPEIIVDLSDALVHIDLPEIAIEKLDQFASEAPDEAGQVQAGMARTRGAALAAMGDHDAAEYEFARGLIWAVENGDLLEEVRILEIKTSAGSTDPQDEARAAELHRLLGITST